MRLASLGYAAFTLDYQGGAESPLQPARDALGNLLGSSVFNIALILGPTVIAAPGAVPVPADLLALDMLLMVTTALVCVPAFFTRRQLTRGEGGAFVAAYVLYTTWLIMTRL